jgi:two-component system, NarL family, sensor histidine kinase LiaS
MMRWISIISVQFKRLWFQLAVSYTLLAFCGLSVLIAMFYGLDDYNDFRQAITSSNVEERVVSERLTVAQVIHDPANTEWRDKARTAIREKLINMERGSASSIYRISNSSHPEVYIQISDANGRVVMTDPAILLPRVAAHFSAFPPDSKARVVKQKDNGTIWVDLPVANDQGDVLGRLRVLFIAKFNLWVELQSIFGFLLFAWGPLFLCSVPIGVACGVVASCYVKTQLRKMNDVTESWRQGDFAPRIELPNDDILIRHSRHLNDMAQDLEMYLSLKQSLAVSDERNRVARELHDTVKQKLFALGLQLATAKAKPGADSAKAHILEAEAITREAQRDLMEIITQLRPAGTGDISLRERITMIAADFRRRFGINVVVEQVMATGSGAVVEHHLLRIVQEALANAVRHGKASEISISGNSSDGTAWLTISDNGIGFDPTRKAGGFGITSMRERMRDVPGGTFEIDSCEGSGTRVKLSWSTAP